MVSRSFLLQSGRNSVGHLYRRLTDIDIVTPRHLRDSSWDALKRESWEFQLRYAESVPPWIDSRVTC
jgi:hypothetical protein